MVKQFMPKAGEAILALFNKLGGNMNNVLGSRSNITFLGKGKTPEGFIDSDINIDAIGFLGKNKILEELESSIGYLTAGKLNDVQANKLLSNMTKIDELFNPPQIANVTDLRTGTRDITQEGLGSLREKELVKRFQAGEKTGKPAMKEVMESDIRALQEQGIDPRDTILPSSMIDDVPPPAGLDDYKQFVDSLDLPPKGSRGGPNDIADARLIDDMYRTAGPRSLDEDKMYLAEFIAEDAGKVLDDLPIAEQNKFIKRAENALIRNVKQYQDLPPPGSRGGPEDIASPLQDAETTIKNLEKQDPILAAQMKKMMDEGIISTVTNKGDIPSKRASAREFLVEALKKDEYDAGTAAFGKVNLNNVISAEDVRYITEGGGGIGGDPIVLVEKYFGPRIAEALPTNASNEEILIFTKRVLENVQDASGLKPDNPRFDRFTARFVDEMADGGRVGLKFGRAAGKAYGLYRKAKAIEKSVDAGEEMGYQALRKYGLEAEDITRLFKEIAMDRTLVGPEKTNYFKMLNQVLKNPDEFPDGIIEIKKRLGMDFARGGLAKILEV